MNAKVLISMCFMLFLNIALASSTTRKQILLQRRDIPIKRELVMAPEVGNGKELDRESIIVPRASVENGVINIETEFASWGVAITIYNSDGMRMLLQ